MKISIMGKILILCLTGIFAFIVYVRLLEATSVFYPQRNIPATPRDLGLPFEDIFFETRDQVALNGWFVKADHQREDTATMIFFHGNGGNISGRLSKIEAFHEMGLNVFIFDYRGYGKSAGRPSERGFYLDSLAAYDYTVQRKDVRGDAIVLYGESLGGAGAVHVAARRKVAAAIFDSTFTSAADMAKIIAPFVPRFLLRLKFDNLSEIREITCPKLFTHSRDDEMIPYRLGRTLFEAAPEPKEFLEVSGGHNGGYFVSKEIFLNAIQHFLQQAGLL